MSAQCLTRAAFYVKIANARLASKTTPCDADQKCPRILWPGDRGHFFCTCSSIVKFLYSKRRQAYTTWDNAKKLRFPLHCGAYMAMGSPPTSTHNNLAGASLTSASKHCFFLGSLNCMTAQLEQVRERLMRHRCKSARLPPGTPPPLRSSRSPAIPARSKPAP